MRRWRRTSWLLTLTLLVFLSTPAAAQMYMPQAGSGSIIEPGYAIGSLTLDMSLAHLLWNLGIPAVDLSGPGPEFRANVTVDAWADPPIVALSYPGNYTPVALGIVASGYATRKQIGVGAAESKVTAAYGNPSAVVQLPSRPKILIYDTLGIAFEIAYNNATGTYDNVERVFVFRPGQAGGIWKTP